ncbi:MAG: hypothetical protein FWC70_08965 [Defluviitaleaceae bacterium]|nr:hypothetical protein [Defluviitaleaceae bacterium]
MEKILKKIKAIMLNIVVLIIVYIFIALFPRMIDAIFCTNLANEGGEVLVPIITQVIMVFLATLALRQTYKIMNDANEDRRKSDRERRKADKLHKKFMKSMQESSERIIQELRQDREDSRKQHREFMERMAERDKELFAEMKKLFRSRRRF